MIENFERIQTNKKKSNEAEGSRTPNLEIWSLTQYHYATAPISSKKRYQYK